MSCCSLCPVWLEGLSCNQKVTGWIPSTAGDHQQPCAHQQDAESLPDRSLIYDQVLSFNTYGAPAFLQPALSTSTLMSDFLHFTRMTFSNL